MTFQQIEMHEIPVITEHLRTSPSRQIVSIALPQTEALKRRGLTEWRHYRADELADLLDRLVETKRIAEAATTPGLRIETEP